MNYFERLVRRAVQQPAPRAGAAIFNPFEQIAEWPFDAQARTEPPPSGPAAAVIPPEPPAVSAPLETARAPVDTRADFGPPPATYVQPATPAREAPVAAIEPGIAVTPPVEPPRSAPSINAPSDELPMPLARADEFLRGLGVRVPPTPAVTTIARPHAAPVAPPDATPVRVSHPQPEVAAVPVTPPQPLPVPRPPRVVEERQRPESPRPAVAEPTRGRLAVPQAREVIVVERRHGAAELKPTARVGVGSPHVGLGQL